MKTKSFLLLALLALNLNAGAQTTPTSSQTAQGGVGSTPGAAPTGTVNQTNGIGNTNYGGTNYDINGYRTGPYYLDTITTNSASTISPAGGSVSATGVPMGVTPTSATGVPMGTTPTTGTGGTIGVTTLSQWCVSNPGADACRNNQPLPPVTNR